ncbi:helix-turn-helix domain-containing protein [Lentzea sp. NPDC058450]|uniref:helix-turn-helix domain-containing protein n=1 Tax=Lentzea sp. NPDC058450 TaxID=3346505 RepID=UPI003667B727
MQIRWQLRQVMASREIWKGADLIRLLQERAGFEISSASMSALLNHQPSQVKWETLQALCTALSCTPNELFGVDAPGPTST